MHTNASPLIARLVTVEHGVSFDAVFQEYFLNRALLQGRDAYDFFFHPIILCLPYAKNNIVFDILSLGIRKFIVQLAHAERIEYRLVTQILLTVHRITDESRVKYFDISLVG